MPVRTWFAAAMAAGVLSAVAGLARAAEIDITGLDIRRSGDNQLATFVTAKAPGGAPVAGARQAIPVVVPRSRERFTGQAFWDQYGALFGVVDPISQLQVESVEVDALGDVHTTFRQVHEGLPVFSGVLKLHHDAQGRVIAANGHFYPIKPSLSTKPTIDELAAQRAARFELAANAHPIVEDCELVVVDPGWYGDAPTGPRLAYRVILTDLDAAVRESFFIDAHTAGVLDRWSLIEQALNRSIHDAAQTAAVPGPLARAEGAPPVANAEVNKAYDFSGDFYDFIQRGFGRDSIDNAGFVLRATVNSRSTGCPNAYWNGLQSVYCTGVVTDDIVAHEICHGLIERTAALIYQNQSGQLNESFADVFGELVDLYNGDASEAGSPAGTPWPSISPSGSGTDTPNNLRTACSPRPTHPDGVRWLIGEDSAGFGGALRDMALPTCLGDPDRANSPLMTCQAVDAGGVHHGSAVPNKAFTLLVDGGAFNGRTVVGIGTIKAGAVWYRALTIYLTPAGDFQDAYDALVQSAIDLQGIAPNDPRTGLPSASALSALDVQQVVEALQAVELNSDGACGQSDNVLDSTTPPECVNATVVFAENFEAGPSLPAGWTVSNTGPPIPYDWAVSTLPLPYGRPGAAFYCPDLSTGNCAGLGETGLHYATTPVIAMPAGTEKPLLAFTHYLSTEGRFDGGRVEISIAGGAWTPIARQDFEFNPYNSFLMAATYGNTNPLASTDAFSGLGGRWGRSIVRLAGYGVAGQNIQVRWVLSKDSCDGGPGWYIDDVAVYTCPDCDGDSVPDIDQFLFRRCFATTPNIGWQSNSVVTLTNPPTASAPVRLELLAIGDFSASDEAIDVFINNTNQGRVFAVGGIDCASTPIRGWLSVPAATWNGFAASGTITVSLQPTAFVSAGDCNGSSVGLHIEYARPVADINGNRLLDSCDCPIVTQAPQPQVVVHGQNASFTVAAIGQSPLLYQWRQGGNALADGPSPGGGTISGATTASLAITAAGPADAGSYDVLIANACGPTPAGPATLTVTPACPTVGTHPQPLTIDAGQNAVFSVTPGPVGTPPLSFQWRRNGDNLADGPSPGGGVISGAAADTLTISAAGYSDAANFDCVISNACGSATSAGAALTVNAVCPIITQHPQPQTVVDGGNVSFSAAAIGVAPFTYRWRLDGVDLADGPAAGGGVISGATTDTLTITGAGYPDIGTGATGYDVVISNTCGSATSTTAALTVNPACPSIAAQPQPVTIDAGQDAIFSVTVGGTAPFTYQWRRNGVNLSDGPSVGGGTISGAAAGTLTITAAGYDDSGTFDCIITNACGGGPATTVAVALTVNPVCPIITQPPAPQTATDGGNASFTVVAIGQAPFTYRWRLAGVDLADGPAAGGGTISGAATDTLTVTGVGFADASAGAYDVVVTNTCGSATSAGASLAVNPACPGLTTQPQPVAIDSGQNAVFTVAVGGTAPFTYQWRRNGVALADGPSVGGGTISGAAADTLTITATGYFDAADYDCVITNACPAPTTSAAAGLSVNAICPVITQQPQPQTATDGGGASFTVASVGQATLTYQWRRDGVILADGPSIGGGVISGAATATLTITGLGMLDAASANGYDVVVSNTCGSATSAPAALTVNPACPSVTAPPQPVTVDAGLNTQFTVAAAGTPPFTYQWRRDGVALADGPAAGGGVISGAATTTLTITGVGYPDAGGYDVVITNACGPATSPAATLTVTNACAADFNESGLVSVQDIFDFLAAYFAGDMRADFNHSGAISVQDIFDYLAAYFAGCP